MPKLKLPDNAAAAAPKLALKCTALALRSHLRVGFGFEFLTNCRDGYDPTQN